MLLFEQHQNETEDLPECMQKAEIDHSSKTMHPELLTEPPHELHTHSSGNLQGLYIEFILNHQTLQSDPTSV